MSRVFAIGDLHLSSANPKPMDVFGEPWRDHPQRLEANWRRAVGPADLVLLPGDLSWAMTLDEARPDLAWLAGLPGKKILIKGNHDYWWRAIGRVRGCLEGLGIFAIQNDACLVGNVAIAGTRLWIDPQLSLRGIPFQCAQAPAAPRSDAEPRSPHADKKLWERELQRLGRSLEAMSADAEFRVVMTHFPPVNEAGEASEAALLIERAHVDYCVFGHLHGIDADKLPELRVERNGVVYRHVACDHVNFTPCRIY